jgi:chromosomal replication initiation ATPase DnaA
MSEIKFSSAHFLNIHNHRLPAVNEILNKCKTEIEQILKCQVNVFCRIGHELVGEAELKNIVCEICEIDQAQLLNSDRTRHIVIARHLYCYFASNVLRHTYKRIGDALGKRDHTTAIHGKAKVADMIYVHDHLYMPAFKEVQARLNELINTSRFTEKVAVA